MPVTVNQRDPLRPIQRPARPDMMELIKGINTMTTNISLLLLREYSSGEEYVLCKHETSVRFRLFPLRSLLIKTNPLYLSLYKKDFSDNTPFYFNFPWPLIYGPTLLKFTPLFHSAAFILEHIAQW